MHLPAPKNNTETLQNVPQQESTKLIKNATGGLLANCKEKYIRDHEEVRNMHKIHVTRKYIMT